jgi:hypothetical protein
MDMTDQILQEHSAHTASLSRSIAESVRLARIVSEPFFHLEFDQVFPDELYSLMVGALPTGADYRPLPGRSGVNLRPDGTSSRVKVDLFPEFTRHFPAPKRIIWDQVGQALCSVQVREALVRQLGPGLEQRFGKEFKRVRFFPIPVLTRDTPGYRIPPHTDTHWKGITVQLYLPRDESTAHVGTVFHKRLSDGSLPVATRMRFAPNTGYAFAVGEDTWHSVEPLGNEVSTRDSILLTYFVDSGLLRFARNRARRAGNYFLSEWRHLRFGQRNSE